MRSSSPQSEDPGALRALYLEVFAALPADAKACIEAELFGPGSGPSRKSKGPGAEGQTLRAAIEPASLARRVGDERRAGALSRKVAFAQVHRNLARAGFGALAGLWLLKGRVPEPNPLDALRLAQALAEGRAPACLVLAASSGDASRLSAAVAELAEALGIVARPGGRGLAPVQRSNAAIGLLRPWLALRRQAPAAPDLTPFMRGFLERIAPSFAGGVEWPPATPSGGAFLQRTACCLRYCAGPKRFCGTCPFRRDEPGPGGGG